MIRTLMAMAIAGVTVLAAAPVSAGDNNSAFVRQLSPDGSINGNVLSLDQTGATNATVKGVSNILAGNGAAFALGLLGNTSQIATQRGEGNTATLTMTGNGGQLELFQTASPLQQWAPGAAGGNNTANIELNAAGLAGIVQIGSDNIAGISVLGDGARGLVSQAGSNLTADLTVGSGGTGRIVQIGSNIDSGSVTIPPDSMVTLTQTGSNISPLGTGLQVLIATNPGHIVINQTSW